MIIVVDANIISALLGSRGKLTILTSQNHIFYAPKTIVKEIRKYKSEICEKSGQSPAEFDVNFDAVLAFITEIDPIEYEPHVKDAYNAIGRRDSKDTDYLACALAVHAAFIWTEDKDFSSQNLVAVKSTDSFIQSGR
ncbi:MAG TPA: PIN domain-containing protein [Candidatus Nanoarchaeia archaeon]|nr:PIN domain-containing protein [Candidatus Nanoarchaeia archaeon]